MVEEVVMEDVVADGAVADDVVADEPAKKEKAEKIVGDSTKAVGMIYPPPELRSILFQDPKIPLTLSAYLVFFP